ncbi:MAG: acyl-CoA thioesterase [Bacteriovoracaceae bacterium]|jgi:YbgC/YbaW family acyl-CoA thioester hydrolase|nr:acyl-CoA thioesterase [Bacteriovoracaceae bacterium]
MEGPIFKYQFKVLEQHLDSFGHVNNATYLELYEQARWEFITEGGYGLKEVLELKKGPVILDINLRFSKELLLRENINIESTVKGERGKKIFEIHQKMLKGSGDVASKIVLRFGFMDLDNRSLILPTEKWLKAIGHNFA